MNTNGTHFRLFDGETAEQAGARIDRFDKAEQIVKSETLKIVPADDRYYIENSLEVTVDNMTVRLNPIQAARLLDALKDREAEIREQALALGAKVDAAYIENGYEDGAWS